MSVNTFEDYYSRMIDYVRHLNSLNEICENVADRQKCRELYNNSYKVPKVTFSTFIYDMKCVGIVKKKDPSTITFNKRNVTSVLTGNNGANTIKQPTKTYVSQSYATKKERTPPKLTSKNACKLCNMQFADLLSYEDHIKQDLHKYSNIYATNKKYFRSAERNNGDILIEVVPKHGSGSETTYLKPTDHFILNIINTSDFDYEIVGVVQLNNRAKEISTSKLDLPLQLPKKGIVMQKITCRFTSVSSVEYPQVFLCKNKNTNDLREVLKELIIHGTTEKNNVVSELLPTESYSNRKPVYSEATDIIVPGEKPDSSAKSSTIARKLPQYQIPPDVLNLLNKGLKDSETNTKSQTKLLKSIRELIGTNEEPKAMDARNYNKYLQMLVYFEEHQLTKDIHDYDRDNQTLTHAPGYRNNFYELEVPGLAEHRPSLIRGDSVYIKTDSNSKVKYQGYVHRVKLNSVVLGFHRKFTNEAYAKNRKFMAFFTLNRFTIRAEQQAAELTGLHGISGFVFPKVDPIPFEDDYNFTWFEKRISNNPEQQMAVKYILNDPVHDAPYLIFGPPGTGKTMTIVEAIKQIWKLKSSKILVCTPSNNAANEITKRLAVCIPKSAMMRYLAASYNTNELPEEIYEYINYSMGHYIYPSVEYVKKYQIVVTTLVTASRLVSDGVPLFDFEYVFIDESGHATETETLIPIAGVLSSAKSKGNVKGRVILAGDPKQLGPIIHSVLAKQYGFDISMLERLMTTIDLYKKNPEGLYDPGAVTKLLKNYRSHPKILDLPNRLFYDGELQACGQEQVDIAVGWDGLPNPKFPIVFHSVIGKDEREGNSPSFFNLLEISLVLDYLKNLIGAKMSGMVVKQSHIAVITPYHKQAEKIRKACGKLNWQDITVGSVEQMQGQERLIIIVSTVRSRTDFMQFDHKFHLGFLKNPKRFNVAVTRAKALLIVIGNPNILQYDPVWKEFIQYCLTNEGFKGVKPSAPVELPPEDEIADAMNGLNLQDVSNTVDGPNFSRGRI